MISVWHAPRQAAAERVSGEHGHLDLLVNVAGILHTTDGISPGAPEERE